MPDKAELSKLPVDQLKRLRQALLPYGLKLLESEWHGWNAQYRFRCRRGHELSRSGSHLLYTLVACPACRDQDALLYLDRVARKAGGRCLSDRYAGRKASYEFVCREGHVFEKTAGNLQKGVVRIVCPCGAFEADDRSGGDETPACGRAGSRREMLVDDLHKTCRSLSLSVCGRT